MTIYRKPSLVRTLTIHLFSIGKTLRTFLRHVTLRITIVDNRPIPNDVRNKYQSSATHDPLDTHDNKRSKLQVTTQKSRLDSKGPLCERETSPNDTTYKTMMT
jgi:hypothetical protein